MAIRPLGGARGAWFVHRLSVSNCNVRTVC